MKDEIFTIIDILGTAAFSISGVYAALEKKLDILGIYIIAFITAIGGGTIRDVIIGDLPVNWILNNNYSVVIFISASIAMIFQKLIYDYQKILIFFDSVGLGFFTLVGIQKGIEFGFAPGLCIALGTITACFGGLIRDITLNHIPHIFHKEIYATACIFGGAFYLILLRTSLPVLFPDIICIATIVILRLLAVRFKWRLPGLQHQSEIK